MTAPAEWEDLRKQARILENEIDAKLMHFSKLCSNYVARHDHHHSNNNQIDLTTTTPNSLSSSDRLYETMSIEIEKLVEKLSDINKRMSDAVPSLLGPNSAATHTLQRHHEILQDYRREFERTKANIRNFKNREDLLMNNNPNDPSSNVGGSGGSQSSSGATVSSGVSSRRQDYNLRELGYLNSSNKLMDANLEMAMKTKSDLLDQRMKFVSITQKVQAIANRFPLINNLMQKIKVKKRKDSIVLGFVIAVCIIILLLYMFR